MSGRRHSLIYVGAGGNIGSHAAIALARTGQLAHLTLVDPDVYEPRNLQSQDIARRDLGRAKVAVLAARIRRIVPELRVDAIAEPVERVPLGRLRHDVIATGLDNLAARRWVNRAARRLGVPFVDAGVRADGLLVRVDVLTPCDEAACLECAWSPAERAQPDNRYPCDAQVAPSGAPAYLGAIAAGLQCAECVKILARETRHTLAGRQLLAEVNAHRHYVSAHRRAPDCGFDHRRWSIRSLAETAGAMTLHRALNLARSPSGAHPRLRVPGDCFARRLVCTVCDATRELLQLAARIGEDDRACPRCGAPMAPSGLDTADTLGADDLGAAHRRVSLHALGLRAGDVFSIETGEGEAHYEIGGR